MRGLRLLSLSVVAALLRKHRQRRTSKCANNSRHAQLSSTEDGRRGRDADKPAQIPLAGWKDVLYRIKDEMSEDNISVVSAGVAFYGLLALIPALAALASIYGLVVSPSAVQSQFANLIGIIPEASRQLLIDQLARISSAPNTNLGLTAVGSLLLALLSAMKGAKALIAAANITYDEREHRGFIKLNIAAFTLTLSGILFTILALGLIAAFPIIIGYMPLPGGLQAGLALLRWPVLAVLLIVGLAAFYRFAPNRTNAKWRWVTWGSVLATALWVIGSALFSLYVSHFANYNKTYGSLGAVVGLLMWLYLSAYVILLGAEMNAEMEHQTARDSTICNGAPIGQRGAYVADTIGKSKTKR